MSKERLFHLGAKAFIRNSKGEVLLLFEDTTNHSIPTDPYWDLPGGRLQEGETVEDALRREIFEEIGAKEISIGRQLSTVVSNHNIRVSKDITVGIILSVYNVSLPGDTVQLSSEHAGFEWCALTEAKKRLAHKYPVEFTDRL